MQCPACQSLRIIKNSHRPCSPTREMGRLRADVLRHLRISVRPIGTTSRLEVGMLRRTSNAAVVLREPRHLTSAIDRQRQLADAADQNALDVVLPQCKPVWVAGGKVADVQRN